MYKKFEKLLDDAEKALPREAFDAVLIVVGDDPDPQWDAQNLADALCDPEVLELNELDEQADADIVEKPARDWIDFRDGSMVNFATGERYARAVEAPDED